MELLNKLLVKSERLIHHKIKEFIAKSLVYFFTIKEVNEFSKKKYKDFEHVLDKYENMINIAHRGFSGKYPENTLLSFKKAIEEKVNMIELDITFSKDGEIVVFHDVNMQRVSSSKKHIRDLSYEKINSFEVGSWFKDEYFGLKVPKLIEVFEIIDDSTLINIEIKHEASSFINRNSEKKLLALIKEYNMENRVVLSSFNPMIVNRIRKLEPNISTAYLITQTMNPFLIYLLAKINAKFIHIDFKYLNKKNIKRMKSYGLKINTYTLNSYDEYNQAFKFGLNGIFTDYPDKLNKLLSSKLS
ncbi:MAG: glycerophosphodiester phosphodiesterase family protein [Cyanobacteriota bacterium]